MDTLRSLAPSQPLDSYHSHMEKTSPWEFHLAPSDPYSIEIPGFTLWWAHFGTL